MNHFSAGRLAMLCALGVGSAVAASATDRIPITTSSADARQAYLKGRDLSEKLRATDARINPRPATLHGASRVRPGLCMATENIRCEPSASLSIRR